MPDDTVTLTVEAPRRSWLLRLSGNFALRLDELRWGHTLNLLSTCCSAWVEWLPDPARLSCGECGELTWTGLDVRNPAYSHYCDPTSSLILAWCEAVLDPLEAELAAASIRSTCGELIGEAEDDS